MARGHRNSVRGPAAVIRTLGSLVIVLALLAGVFSNPRPASACSCVHPFPPLAEYADEIAVAFVGRQIDRIPDPSGGITLVFEVDRVYKGQAGPLIEVRTAYGGGDCGVDYGRAGTIGITAERRGDTGWWVAEVGDLMVHLCGSAAPEHELEEVFGAGYPPDPAIQLSEPQTSEPPDPAIQNSAPPDNSTTILETVSVGIVLVALVAELIAMRRRRRRAGR